MDQTQDREIVIHLKGVLEIFNDIMRPPLKHLMILEFLLDNSLFKYLSLFNRKAFRADNAPHQPVMRRG